MDKKTVLTRDISPGQTAKHKKRKGDFEIIQMLCECWYESLNESSISYRRSIEEITDMIEINIKRGKITESAGWILIGQYAIKCRGVLNEGHENGKPSGLIRLLKDAKKRLPNPVRSNKDANDKDISMNVKVSIYERHSAKLAEYGVKVQPSTLRHWFEDIP